jgi:Mn-containing catalase
MNLKILNLMRAPREKRDLKWLKDTLQSALELELSTLPPYLCGQWSLQDQGSGAATLIKGVTLDEISHLGLVCNLVRAIGEQPKIFAGYDSRSSIRAKCQAAYGQSATPSSFPVTPFPGSSRIR